MITNYNLQSITIYLIFKKSQMQAEQAVEILSLEELNKFYSELEIKCQMMEDFEDPGVTN